MSDSISMQTLLERLRAEGLDGVPSDRDVADTIDEARSEDDEDPWYIRTIAGAGAWLTALALLGFLSCSSLVHLDGPTPYVWGVLFLAIGVVVHHVRGERGVYTPQFALASSLTGQGLLVGGAAEMAGVPAAFAVQSLAAILLYPLYATAEHRFLSSLGAFVLGMATAVDLQSSIASIALFGVEVAVVLTVFTPDRIVSLRLERAGRPLGYAATLGAIALSSEIFLIEVVGHEHLWPYRGIAAVGLIYLIYRSVAHAEEWALEPAVWGAGAVVLLSVISTPGLLVALSVLFVGVWRGHAALRVLGIVALGYHVWEFYYSLSTTLAVKSIMLLASGCVLLALRAWFRRRPWMNVEEAP